jgi:hypothetical protein
MKIKMIKAFWGMAGSLEESFEKTFQAGYEGIEAKPPDPEYEQQFKKLLKLYKFDYVAQLSGTMGTTIEAFQSNVERALRYDPILINSQSARDCMTYDQQVEFFGRAIEIELAAGIPIGHETHRHRAMFTPWSTAKLLTDFKDLKITADFSHWCCVCESLLEDQLQYLDIAMKRTIHLHSRVGYAQGPQVPDPRAPEYSRELDAHMNWWLQIINLISQKGAPWLTIVPEFGPPNYMHTIPFTGEPVADLWDICLWMADTIKKKEREVKERNENED